MMLSIRLITSLSAIFIFLTCAQPPAPGPRKEIVPIAEETPVINFNEKRLTASLSIPHGTKHGVDTYRAKLQPPADSLLTDVILDPILTTVADESLRTAIRTIILNELPPQAVTYKLTDVIVTDSATILFYGVDTSAIKTFAEATVTQYSNPKAIPPYPLFSLGTDVPAKDTFNHLQLILPCEEQPVPQRTSLLPNAPRPYRHGIHRGIDFFADWGTPVRSVADGVVTRADHDFKEVPPEFRLELLNVTKQMKRTPSDVFEHILLGQSIYIDHGSDLVPGYRAISIYAHLSSIAAGISPGRRVKQGQIIGNTGNTGTKDSTLGERTGTHLHWELILQNKHGEYYLGQGLDYNELYPLLNAIFSE